MQFAVERHVHGPSADEPLITSTTSVGLGMVFADERGSVVGVYDAANPSAGVQTQGYGTWGETGSAGVCMECQTPSLAESQLVATSPI